MMLRAADAPYFVQKREGPSQRYPDHILIVGDGAAERRAAFRLHEERGGVTLFALPERKLVTPAEIRFYSESLVEILSQIAGYAGSVVQAVSLFSSQRGPKISPPAAEGSPCAVVNIGEFPPSSKTLFHLNIFDEGGNCPRRFFVVSHIFTVRL